MGNDTLTQKKLFYTKLKYNDFNSLKPFKMFLNKYYISILQVELLKLTLFTATFLHQGN